MSNYYVRTRNRLIYESLMNPSFYRKENNLLLKEYGDDLGGSESADYLTKKITKNAKELAEQISLAWEAAGEFSWDDIKHLNDRPDAYAKLVLLTLAFDTGSLLDPTGILDMTSGMLNLVWAVETKNYSFLVFWMPLFQMIMGAVQLGLLVGGGSLLTPLTSLIKVFLTKGGRAAFKFFLDNLQLIFKAIRTIKDSLINLLSKSKVGRWFASKIDNLLEDLMQKTNNFFSLGTASSAPFSFSQLAAAFTSLRVTQAFKAGLDVVKIKDYLINFLKTYGMLALQATFLRINVGATHLEHARFEMERFQSLTLSFTYKAERKMRDEICKKNEENKNLCSLVYTDPKTLQTSIIEDPNKLYSEPKIDSDDEDEKAAAIELYDSDRNKFFTEFATNTSDPLAKEYLYLLDKMMKQTKAGNQDK